MNNGLSKLILTSWNLLHKMEMDKKVQNSSATMQAISWDGAGKETTLINNTH